MAMITLDKIKNSLENEIYEVRVPKEVAERAKEAFNNTIKILES